jgi:TonB-linked SusC/RagA family outer membrane protein
MKIKQHFKNSINYFYALTLLLGLLLSNEMKAQNSQVISGLISDTSGLPLSGVNIVEKGTKNSTSSNFDGKFSFNVTNANATLVLSYIGFEPQEVNLAGRNSISIKLKSDSETLKEVVVVGYGKVKKSDLTGSVGTIKGSDIAEKNTTNVIQGMQGAVAGVQIQSSTGRLGDPFTVTIRGKNSMNPDSKPLYIVDGTPTDGIDFLNPQDISRIDVLKDASSTAIYGSRGSNGVIIVTTKSGATVKSNMTVSFDTYTGGKEVARLPEMMSGAQWWNYHQSAYLPTAKVDPVTGTITPATLSTAVAGTQNSLLLERVQNDETYDWYKGVLKSGMQSNNYLAIAGRSEGGLAYNMALGVQNETGNIDNESLKKYTFKLGLNHKINDKFTIGLNLTVAKTNQQLGSDFAMREAFRLSPYYSPYAADGTLTPFPGKITDPATGLLILNKTSTYNPLLEIANSANDVTNWTGVGNMFLEYKALDWLSFKSSYYGGFENIKQGEYSGAQTNNGVATGNLSSGKITDTNKNNYTWDNQFNINYTFKEDHHFDFLGLVSMFSKTTQTLFGASGYMLYDTGYDNLGTGQQSTYNLDSSFDRSTLNSYLARLNYNYKGKYLLTVSTRYDGSSKFVEGQKWGSFPSAAAGWNVTEESFMQNQKVVSELKLRGSFGYTGNNIIPSYSTLANLDQLTYYEFNGVSANGGVQKTPNNIHLGWEKTQELDFGVDFGFIKNRITGSVDVYDRLSKNLLLDQKLVIENGYPTYTTNIGSVSNRGIEASLSTKNIDSKMVSWVTNFTFTKNVNSIKSIYDEVTDDVGNNLFIGESIDAIYNYKFDGIWQADQKAEAALYNQTEGQAKVVDTDGNGKITPEDRQILGNSNPKWSGSFSSNLKVGNFDLLISAFSNQGVTVYSQFHANFTNTSDRGRQKADIDVYVPENTAGLPTHYTNEYPQATNEGIYWNQANNKGVGYYRDASFVKIQNITLGYTFNRDVINKFKLKYLRFYVNVLNPFVFTKYDGFDPEWASGSLNLSRVGSITYQMGMSIKL